MNIILLAAPSAGKGTQSLLIKDKYKIGHISTGDLLRREALEPTEMGKYIKMLMDNGSLVDDSIIFELIEKAIQGDDCKNGYILDGFPRTIAQAETYNEILKKNNSKIDAVIYMDITMQEAMNRALGRITCPQCNAIYNLSSIKPKVDGICDKCGTKLLKRDDDNEETFKQRFENYVTKTQPLIEYYDKLGLLKVVDSNISKEYTFSQIEKILG